MKKFLACALLFVMMFSVLVSCGSGKSIDLDDAKKTLEAEGYEVELITVPEEANDILEDVTDYIDIEFEGGVEKAMTAMKMDLIGEDSGIESVSVIQFEKEADAKKLVDAYDDMMDALKEELGDAADSAMMDAMVIKRAGKSVISGTKAAVDLID